MTEIPNLTWSDEDRDRIVFTNTHLALRSYSNAVAMVQVHDAFDPEFAHGVLMDLDEAKCLRRWLDDLIRTAGEASDASR